MSRRIPSAIVAVLVCTMVSGLDASPATSETEVEENEIGAGRRAGAVGTALVPGLLVHGAGLYVAGDHQGAKRLFALEGLGLAMMAAGGVPLALTGASRKLSWPTIPLLVSGWGIFTVSWLADIYGAAGLSRWAGGPRRPAPVELDVGYAYIRDVHFAYDHFSTLGARFFAGDFRIEPTLWAALTTDNQRWRLEGSYRLLGPTPNRTSGDDTSLDLTSALTFHRYGRENFSTRAGELSVDGRLDLARISPSLRGGFAELSTGIGMEWFAYDLGADDADDVFGMLLGTFALGMRMGTPGALSGEVRLSYDHRREDFAAGFSPSASGSGYAGHFGLSGLGYVRDWGLRAEVWLGAGHIYQLSLLRRFGSTRQ